MLKISCFILLSAVLLTSLIALSACRQGDEVFEPEPPPSPCAVHELVGAAFINQAATLARDEMLKTYTLTFSPVSDSTAIGIVCDTSAYDLSALLGHVRFSGQLRAAGQDVPQPAAGQAYYSLELEDAPTREEEDETPPAKPDKEPEDNTPPTSPNEGEGPAIVGGGSSPNEEPEENMPPEMPEEDLTQDLQHLIPFGEWSLTEYNVNPNPMLRELLSTDDIVWDFSKSQVQVTIKKPLSSTSQMPIKTNGEYPVSRKKSNEIVINNVAYRAYIYLFLDGGTSHDGPLFTFRRPIDAFHSISQDAWQNPDKQYQLFFGKWNLISYQRMWTFREYSKEDVIWNFSKNKVNVTINDAVSNPHILPIKNSGEYMITIRNSNEILIGEGSYSFYYSFYMRLILEKKGSASNEQLIFKRINNP